MADKTELLQLKKEIERHNKLYHEQDNPEISDAEYDALYQRLKELENIFGIKIRVKFKTVDIEKGKSEIFMKSVLNNEEGLSKISTCKKVEKFEKES